MKTVLHVEDDRNDILMMDVAVKSAKLPLDIKAVEDGDDAIAYLQGFGAYTNREKFPLPHLVLTDLKMHRCSGFEVIRWIREHEQFKDIPVVVLTSSEQPEDKTAAEQLGANDYQIKPLGIRALVELVESIHLNWLERRKEGGGR